MTPLEVHLRALEVLEAAVAERPDPAALLDGLRPDLEVLSRDDLIRVVVAAGVEVSRTLGPLGRPKVADRLEQRRLRMLVGGQ